MAIRFRCEQCAAKMRVGDGNEGKKVKCPKCGQLQRVPKASQAGATSGKSTADSKSDDPLAELAAAVSGDEAGPSTDEIAEAAGTSSEEENGPLSPPTSSTSTSTPPPTKQDQEAASGQHDDDEAGTAPRAADDDQSEQAVASKATSSAAQETESDTPDDEGERSSDQVDEPSAAPKREASRASAAEKPAPPVTVSRPRPTPKPRVESEDDSPSKTAIPQPSGPRPAPGQQPISVAPPGDDSSSDDEPVKPDANSPRPAPEKPRPRPTPIARPITRPGPTSRAGASESSSQPEPEPDSASEVTKTDEDGDEMRSPRDSVPAGRQAQSPSSSTPHVQAPPKKEPRTIPLSTHTPSGHRHTMGVPLVDQPGAPEEQAAPAQPPVGPTPMYSSLLLLGWVLRAFAAIGVAGAVKLMLWASRANFTLVDQFMVLFFGVMLVAIALGLGEGLLALRSHLRRMHRR